ncbi:MAG: dolichyl-phosphate beta-glucosyltransferase [Nitrospinota bacterium]|nr:dolichyl-phosphate beta-glucosyltransferase [Nitrospinota bacterium]
MLHFLSVIIPAYNEETRLARSLPQVREFLTQRLDTSWEVIIVDDGSSDNTASIPCNFFEPDEFTVVRNGQNKGKGYSVRQGAKAAKGPILLFSDADLSTPMKDFDKLYAFLQKGYDVAIGSRSLSDSNVVVHQPWYREGMGKTFNKLVCCLVVDGFIDTQCGFKCFRRELADTVLPKMTIDRFSFDVEFLFLAKKAGYKIAEVPVEWHNVLQSRVRIVRDTFNMLCDLFRIRLNDLMGRYD